MFISWRYSAGCDLVVGQVQQISASIGRKVSEIQEKVVFLQVAEEVKLYSFKKARQRTNYNQSQTRKIQNENV